jgi:autotransporter-associated beta strand protein
VDGGDSLSYGGTLTLTTGNLVVTTVSGAFTLSNAVTAIALQTGTSITGPLDLSGSGSVVLSGSSGTALIGGSTLNLGGGTVTFNMGGSTGPVMQVSSAMSNGSLTVTGSGLLDLTGVNTYVGPTTVSSGTLAVNGSITSNTTVDVGATLQGTGTITGNVDVFGTMAPGNSIGTMNITGNYEQHPGSTLANEITPTSTDLVKATGNITIDPGATFALMPDPGIYTAGTIYEVMQSTGGAVTGTFSNFTNSNPMVMGRLFYTPTGVFFEINQTGLVLMATTGNAAKVAAALDAVVASGNTSLNPLIMTLVPLNHSQLVSALSELQPSLYKGMAVVQENNVVKVHDALGYRFQNILDEKECCAHPKKKLVHIWVDGLGDFSNQKNTHFASSPQVGYGSTTAGAVGGIDFNALENLYVGALGAYTHSNVSYKNHQGHGEINSGYAGLYASAIGKIFYGNAAVIRSWNRYDARRNIVYPGMNETARNKHSGNQVLTHFDTGLNFNAWKLTIRPFDSFDYITQQEESFKEHGGGLTNLSVLGKTLRMVRNELGLNFAKCFSIGKSPIENKPKRSKKPLQASRVSETSGCESDKLIVDAKFSWVREMRLKGKSSTSQFIGTGVHFTTVGYFTDRSLFSPGLSVTYVTFDDLVDVMAYYNGEFGSKYRDQSVGLEVGFDF